MRRHVVILSEPTVPSYSEIGTLYQTTFSAMGVRSALAAYPTSGMPRVPQSSVVLHNTLGFRFTPLPGVINIAVPFHEWSRYPARWAARLNRFDAVWAASPYLARVLKASGVTIPIEFAPPALGVHPPPAKQAWTAGRPFRFLFVGEPHFRKGHHLLIEGFRLVAREGRRATLTIKTSRDCAWHVDDPGVRVIGARWTRARLLRFYAEHDAFVSASLGEGLGLGVAEAMLAHLPVAANHWGGHTSLLAPGAYVRIPHRVVPQPFCSQPDFFAPGQQCALSSPDGVAAAMRTLIAMTASQRRGLAARARLHLEQHFGLAAASRRLRAALDQVGWRQGARVGPARVFI